MLELDRVSAGISGKSVLKDVSFRLRPHRITALVGRNGCGKSTLLSCINQQLPYTGHIREGEKDLSLLRARERAARMAILPQILPAPHITVREMVAFGRNPYLDFTGRLTDADRDAVAAAMADASVDTIADRYADTLSGGELQRARLAMILAQNTPIMLLDEPTSHMDLAYETGFLNILSDLKTRRKKTVLVILHDISLAAAYADDILVMDEGRIIFAGSREECLASEILEKTFSLKRYSLADGEGTVRHFFAAI